MLATLISVLGVVITGVGTFVRVVPDINRSIRRHFYNISFTHELFSLRKSIKDSQKGKQFTTEHRAVRREFIDYIDAHHLREPPDELPKKVRNVAADIEVEFSNGDTLRYPMGELGQRILVELLTLSIERECRMKGLQIGIIGVFITILGSVI